MRLARVLCFTLGAMLMVVPGMAFGCDKNVRLSFACSMEQIDKGLDRLD